MPHDHAEERPVAQAERVFEGFLAQQDRGERPEFEQLCAQHPELAAELRRMHREWGVFEWHATRIADRLADDVPAADTHPRQIGTYRILDILGEGGMGIVFVAEQLAPVKRKVALKLIKLGMDSREVVARFGQERQALALMQHDGIAKVFDCGTSDRGQPYFVMELVKGVPLTDYCDQHRLSLPERIRLMQQVCDAVQHAHQKGVVHRDLKPGNVLVAEENGKPQIKIIDFGLAKAMGHKLVEATLHTQTGHVIGTPEYMAPEQADPSNQDVDTRADVYSLGVMLYEVLAGTLPFASTELRQAGLLEMQRVLKEVDPPKPSTRLAASRDTAAAIAGQRRTSATALYRALRHDLDWLVLKAIEKDRARRYETANGLKMDLERYLNHEPLVAGPPSAIYRLRKLVRRYRGQVIAGSAVLGTAIGGTVVALNFAMDANRNEKLATQRAEEKAKLAEEKSVVVREFTQLAGVVRHERAMERERELWPPWPEKIAAMEEWLRNHADKLLAMQDAIDNTVRELRRRARPRTPAEIEAERRAHPRFAEWDQLTKYAASLRYAEEIREGNRALSEPVLTPEQQALDAQALNTFAWVRVASQPDWRSVWGEEALALATARLAAQKAKGTADEYQVLNTLAWALVANAQAAEAKQVIRRAAAVAPKDSAEKHAQHEREVDEAAESHAALVRAVETRAAELDQALGERRIWSFATADEPQQFLHDTLEELQRKLWLLKGTQQLVDRRLRWAEQIRELTLAHPNARHEWPAVRAAIHANPRYVGQTIELRDDDVMGLVPIGENPKTHLWEFYELRSACAEQQDPGTVNIPQHEPDGSIPVAGDTGIVFVLLPGGTFWMGAQGIDPNQPNFDPYAKHNEGPVHQVTLAPFFLARHELTRGQWVRLARTPPFFWSEGVAYSGDAIVIGLTHPAESMSWDAANLWMARHGLCLPTEAQWEYACRAGSATPWSPGDVTNLDGYANVHDQRSFKLLPDWGQAAPFYDGFTGIAPVGQFRANAFGLYDMHGNVSEWCADGDAKTKYETAVRAGDGYRPPVLDDRVHRGGSYYNVVSYTRSAFRSGFSRATGGQALGVRPARALRH